jgi:hypothetical protein
LWQELSVVQNPQSVSIASNDDNKVPVLHIASGSQEDEGSVNSLKTVSTTERDYQQEIMQAIPPISCDISPPAPHELTSATMDHTTNHHQSPEDKLPTSRESMTKLPSISDAHSKATSPKAEEVNKHFRSTETLPEVISNSNTKYSDSKLPSKALQAFEDFLKTEQQNGNAKAITEGRKRANKNSKFKLRKTEENYIATISFSRVHKQLFETELAVFVSMYPKATELQKKNFVETFQRKYPDAKLEPMTRVVQEESITIDYASANSNASIHSLESISKDSQHGTGAVELIGGKLVKVSSKKKASEFSDEKSGHLEFDDDAEEDPELERWQKFTINCLVEQKNGERKEFPSVSVGKLQALETLAGKKYRSRHKIGAGFVTFPPKHTEEPIDGPPSYLELYKTSFKIYTNSKDKARVLEDLRVRKSAEVS